MFRPLGWHSIPQVTVCICVIPTSGMTLSPISHLCNIRASVTCNSKVKLIVINNTSKTCTILVTTTRTTVFILMPLSQLARVGNFCFNLLSPFLLIVRILSLQAILHSSHDFLFQTFFLLPVISNFITSCICELMPQRMA